MGMALWSKADSIAVLLVALFDLIGDYNVLCHLVEC